MKLKRNIYFFLLNLIIQFKLELSPQNIHNEPLPCIFFDGSPLFCSNKDGHYELIQNFFILIVIYHGIKRLIKSVKDKRDPPKNEPFDVAT